MADTDQNVKETAGQGAQQPGQAAQQAPQGTSVKDLIGKSGLFKISNVNGGEVSEYKVLAVSNSGNFVKFQNGCWTNSDSFWVPIFDIQLVELLGE